MLLYYWQLEQEVAPGDFDVIGVNCSLEKLLEYRNKSFDLALVINVYDDDCGGIKDKVHNYVVDGKIQKEGYWPHDIPLKYKEELEAVWFH